MNETALRPVEHARQQIDELKLPRHTPRSDTPGFWIEDHYRTKDRKYRGVIAHFYWSEFFGLWKTQRSKVIQDIEQHLLIWAGHYGRLGVAYRWDHNEDGMPLLVVEEVDYWPAAREVELASPIQPLGEPTYTQVEMDKLVKEYSRLKKHDDVVTFALDNLLHAVVESLDGHYHDWMVDYLRKAAIEAQASQKEARDAYLGD